MKLTKQFHKINDPIKKGINKIISNIKKLEFAQEGAFGGRLIQLNIEAFTFDETKRYVDEKSNNLKFADECFERFYVCTHGIPLYINIT